ncbi:hypothetical protein FOL47_011264, partial [Perkinsus chesapeaki]
MLLIFVKNCFTKEVACRGKGERKLQIYRLILAYTGKAENAVGFDEAFSSLERARALLDVEGSPTGTLHVSLVSRVFTVARSLSVKLQPVNLPESGLYVPPRDGQPPVMLLIILHGFGDGSLSLAKLARGMQLPGVACLVLQGPGRLPSELLPPNSNDIGYYWYDNMDLETGDPLIRGDNTLTKSCEGSLRTFKAYIKDVLIKTVGWESWEIAFLGIGQGGTFALETGRSLEMEFAGLFVLTPDELVLKCPVSRRCSQRIVIVHGKRDEMPESSVQRIVRELESEGDRVELHELPGEATDVLKDSKGEGEVLMRFIAARLAAIRMRSLGAEE